MHNRLRIGAVVLAAATAISVTPTASATAGQAANWPIDAPKPAVTTPRLSCVPVRDEDKVASNAAPFDKLPKARVSGLPAKVHLRDNTSSYNRYWEVTVHKGVLYTRPRGSSTAWREAPVPRCMRGQLVGVSMDAEEVVAIDKAGWLYTLFGVQETPDNWYWKTAWGSLMRAEDGFQMVNTTPRQWALSIINVKDDETYTDQDGVTHQISLAGCTQVLEMSKDGRHIFSHDPWLPNDYSYEWGTPVNSRFIATSLSASASVALITNKYGDLYTRMWDYDRSGGDPAQFRYTFTKDNSTYRAPHWLLQRLNPFAPKIRIPVPDWQRQPKIPGEITDRLSVESTAPGVTNRLLKVEGRKNGITGYWKKMLTARTWTFVPTGEPLQGKLLDNTMRDRTMDTPAPASPLNYRGELNGSRPAATLTVPHFAYQSPHQSVMLTIEGKTYPAVLHTVYGRLASMASQELTAHDFGVTNDPRRYAVALELPASVWKKRSSIPALDAFITSYLQGNRTHEMYMTVTSGTMTLINPVVPGVSISPFISTLQRF